MRRILPLAMLVVGLTGCQSTDSHATVPDDEPPAYAHDLRDTFEYMIDNAVLADMTVSDYHFVPHRAMLTPLGETRLERLAALLKTYGGRVRFNTDLGEDPLVDQRVAAIVAFLADLNVDTTSQVVREDIPGGQGMNAREVILIKNTEGTFQPDATNGSGPATLPLGGSSGNP